MSIIFCSATVSLLRTLAEQAVEFSRESKCSALEIFQAYIGGAFHDIDRSPYDSRIKRTVTFAMESLEADIHPLDVVERLETSLATHGVAWFMLDVDRAKVIDSLEQLREIFPVEIAAQFVRLGAQLYDEIIPYAKQQYLDFLPESHSFGLALVRKNKILSVITFARMSPSPS